MLNFKDVNVGDTVKVTRGTTTVEGIVEPSINDTGMTIGHIYIYKPDWTLVEHVRGYKDGDVATYEQSGAVYVGVYDSKEGAFMACSARMFNPTHQGIKVYGNINE